MTVEELWERNPGILDASSHAWLAPLLAAAVYYCNLLWQKMKM